MLQGNKMPVSSILEIYMRWYVTPFPLIAGEEMVAFCWVKYMSIILKYRHYIEEINNHQ